MKATVRRISSRRVHVYGACSDEVSHAFNIASPLEIDVRIRPILMIANSTQYYSYMSPDADCSHWHEAVNTRDVRYDGVFVVALTSTRVFCRPVCPSRLARPEHRRFFTSCADALAAGFRACRRCRPEAPAGETPLEAVPRLAQQVVDRIASGALDQQSIGMLAGALGLSERHLRRATARAVGASPSQLALAQRLRRATVLLADPRHSIAQVAHLSGFQSVRRFNAVFRAKFHMPPTAWRRITGPTSEAGFSRPR